MVRAFEQVGRRFVAGVEELGYGSAILGESLSWIFFGSWRQQPVHLRLVAEQMMQVGVAAIPIVAVLAFSNGIMMALQGIYTLREIGAQAEVVPGRDELILRLRDAMNRSIVVVTHELESAFKIADRITVLDRDEILLTGDVETVRASRLPPVQALLNRVPQDEPVDPDAYMSRLTRAG